MDVHPCKIGGTYMPFVNIGVETEKQAFESGTKAGRWGFWVNNIFGELAAGPKATFNESIIFLVEKKDPNDQVFVAFAVRLDQDGNRLGPRRFKIFTFEDLNKPGVALILDEIEFTEDDHPDFFGPEILPINNEMKC